MTAGRRALRNAVIRQARLLGCGRKELEILFGMPRPTVNRVVKGLPKPAGRGPRALSGTVQWAVTAFWYEIAGRQGANPPPLTGGTASALLRSFCDICRQDVAAVTRDGARSLGLGAWEHRLPEEPTSLEDLYARAAIVCQDDPRPEQCVAGPARFTLLAAGLRAHPYELAMFLIRHVNTRAVWVRPCLTCGYAFVSPSNAHRHCGCPPETADRHLITPRRLVSSAAF